MGSGLFDYFKSILGDQGPLCKQPVLTSASALYGS